MNTERANCASCFTSIVHTAVFELRKVLEDGDMETEAVLMHMNRLGFTRGLAHEARRTAGIQALKEPRRWRMPPQPVADKNLAELAAELEIEPRSG